MQKSFFIIEKIKNTESSQLWSETVNFKLQIVTFVELLLIELFIYYYLL